MSYSVRSRDWSALIFAQKMVRSGVSELDIAVGAAENSFDLLDLWKKAWLKTLQTTRFGRIGILFEESNKEGFKFTQDLNIVENYSPKDKRALNEPVVTLFPTQILFPMAELGWEKSIEFRRIARKYIRKIKHSQVDTLLLLDPIFAGEECLKVFRHLVGSQIQIITPLDVWDSKNSSGKSNKVVLHTSYSIDKTQEQASRLLKRKVSKKNIETL